MSEKLYLYPLWIRIWHWTNALMFLVLIVTGLSMQYSSPDYPMIRFDWAVSMHNISGVIVIISYLYFIIVNRFSRNRKYYQFIRKGFLDRLMKQFIYYTIGIFKNEQPPFPITEERKFNPMQKFSYLIVMYLGMPALIVTGIALLYPEIIIPNVGGLSGIHLTDLVHIITGFGLSVFMAIHVYFCTIGATTTSNFKSMMNGWHETH